MEQIEYSKCSVSLKVQKSHRILRPRSFASPYVSGDTGLLASVTRDDKIWQGYKYRGIVYYHFAYHFGGKFKLYLVSLLRYGNPTCAIDWFNVPNTVKRKLSFLKTFSKIWTVYHNFNIFSLFLTNSHFQGSHI